MVLFTILCYTYLITKRHIRKHNTCNRHNESNQIYLKGKHFDACESKSIVILPFINMSYLEYIV